MVLHPLIVAQLPDTTELFMLRMEGVSPSSMWEYYHEEKGKPTFRLSVVTVYESKVVSTVSLAKDTFTRRERRRLIRSLEKLSPGGFLELIETGRLKRTY